MTDAFSPEILAAFMQKIVDEPTLPTLFLRTVSPSFHHQREKNYLLIQTHLGNPSGLYIQIIATFRIIHIVFSVDCEEDLGNGSALGRVYSMCESDGSFIVWRVITITERAIEGRGGEAAGTERFTEGVCH
jgi:hypothetical protein